MNLQYQLPGVASILQSYFILYRGRFHSNKSVLCGPGFNFHVRNAKNSQSADDNLHFRFVLVQNAG